MANDREPDRRLLELAAQVPKGYVLLPIKPTRAMLRAMSNATWLCDGSTIEMHRRWNGALDAWSKSKKGRAALKALEALQP
jgi:hypothetical protein